MVWNGMVCMGYYDVIQFGMVYYGTEYYSIM